MENSKTALITGASSGIGHAIANALASLGFSIVIAGRRAERLGNIADEINAKFQVPVKVLVFDIQNREGTKHALQTALQGNWSNIDLLVNNAGLAAGLDPIHSASIDDWETMIDTNIKGLLFVTRFLAKQMVSRQSGQIINVGSIAGKETYPNGSVYAATKHAVDALTKGMRYDLAPFGIRVGSIQPGLVETEFSLVRFKGDAERAKQVYVGYTPLSPTDVADAVKYMVSVPTHVNVADLLLLPTAQASATQVTKRFS